MELLKLLSTSEIIAQVINFLLLLMLLRIFFWRRILGVLDQRKARIASKLKEIEDARADIIKVKAEYDLKLSAIEEEARVKIQEAVVEARRIAQEVREKAQADAAVILEKARQNIELELSKAKEELKGKVVDLTIIATEHIIKERLTQEKDEKLISDFLQGLDKVK